MSDAAQVKLAVVFNLPSAPSSNSNSNSTDLVYTGYKTKLSNSVSSGEFVQKLQSGGGSSVYQSAAVNTVVYSAYSVKTVSRFSAPPTSRPTQEVKSSPTKISSAPSYELGLVVGLLVGGVALLGLMVYFYYSRRSLTVGSDAAASKSAKADPSSESFFFDLERIKPSSATPRKGRAGKDQKRASNIQNIHYDEAVEPATVIPEITQFDMMDAVMFTRVSCDEDTTDKPLSTTETQGLDVMKLEEVLSMKKK